MPTTLQVESVCKQYPTRSGDLVVLRDVSLSLTAGQSAAIMGPSGSGKSTLLNIVGTLDAPSSGHVTVDGFDPFSLSGRKLALFRNRRLGFIFQEHLLLPQCSVLENVLIPTLVGGGNDEQPCGGPERAHRLLDRVGLSDRLDHRPTELSGGEKQRVAIARALINQPALLLADEPTGNLDRATAEKVGELLVEVHREENAILIVATHSERLAGMFGSHWRLEDGTLVTA